MVSFVVKISNENAAAWIRRRRKMGRHGENIRKRKDGRWEGRYKVFDEQKGRNIYRSVYGRAYGEVKEKLTAAKLEVSHQKIEKWETEQQEAEEQKVKSADTPVDAAEVLFSQAAGEWLEEIGAKRKYSTYVKYNTVYQTHLAPRIGACPISAAAREIQEKIFDHLSEMNLSESLRKSICCITNQILTFVNQKYFLSLPLLERSAVKPQKKTVWALSSEEQSKLLHCIYQGMDRFKIAVLLCLYTGMRLGEVCALQWTDIDRKGMTLTVNRTVQRIAVKGFSTRTVLMETDPKSESSRRTIPLTEEMMELLASLTDCQTYVFGGKKPLEPRTMQYQFKKILKMAGIEERNFHLLRHTFATNCVENNMDVKALSEILGHSDVKITLNRYVHPTMDSKRKQLGTLLDFYGQICGQVA